MPFVAATQLQELCSSDKIREEIDALIAVESLDNSESFETLAALKSCSGSTESVVVVCQLTSCLVVSLLQLMQQVQKLEPEQVQWSEASSTTGETDMSPDKVFGENRAPTPSHLSTSTHEHLQEPKADRNTHIDEIDDVFDDDDNDNLLDMTERRWAPRAAMTLPDPDWPREDTTNGSGLCYSFFFDKYKVAYNSCCLLTAPPIAHSWIPAVCTCDPEFAEASQLFMEYAATIASSNGTADPIVVGYYCVLLHCCLLYDSAAVMQLMQRQVGSSSWLQHLLLCCQYSDIREFLINLLSVPLHCPPRCIAKLPRIPFTLTSISSESDAAEEEEEDTPEAMLMSMFNSMWTGVGWKTGDRERKQSPQQMKRDRSLFGVFAAVELLHVLQTLDADGSSSEVNNNVALADGLFSLLEDMADVGFPVQPFLSEPNDASPSDTASHTGETPRAVQAGAEADSSARGIDEQETSFDKAASSCEPSTFSQSDTLSGRDNGGSDNHGALVINADTTTPVSPVAPLTVDLNAVAMGQSVEHVAAASSTSQDGVPRAAKSGSKIPCEEQNATVMALAAQSVDSMATNDEETAVVDNLPTYQPTLEDLVQVAQFTMHYIFHCEKSCSHLSNFVSAEIKHCLVHTRSCVASLKCFGQLLNCLSNAPARNRSDLLNCALLQSICRCIPTIIAALQYWMVEDRYNMRKPVYVISLWEMIEHIVVANIALLDEALLVSESAALGVEYFFCGAVNDTLRAQLARVFVAILRRPQRDDETAQMLLGDLLTGSGQLISSILSLMAPTMPELSELQPITPAVRVREISSVTLRLAMEIEDTRTAYLLEASKRDQPVNQGDQPEGDTSSQDVATEQYASQASTTEQVVPLYLQKVFDFRDSHWDHFIENVVCVVKVVWGMEELETLHARRHATAEASSNIDSANQQVGCEAESPNSDSSPALRRSDSDYSDWEESIINQISEEDDTANDVKPQPEHDTSTKERTSSSLTSDSPLDALYDADELELMSSMDDS